MRRRAPSLSLTQQGLALDRRFPDGRFRLSGGHLTWTAELQPTPLSRTYLIRVTYQLGRQPKVVVIKPALDSRPGVGLPHVWKDGSLCLHRRRDWHPTMFLASSIVPWASEWLMYYEIWKATGSWEGGGEWPPA
jgi:hypothetical protein